MFLVYFFIFLFGLAAGSFLNCLVYRLEISESLEGRPRRKAFGFLRGRSFCPKCRHILSWSDLVPVFSFLFLKGKCRYCQQKISWQYPVVEISTAVMFLIIFDFHFPIFNFLNLIYYWLIASFLIVVFVYDLKHYIIPDKVIYLAIGTALIYNFLSSDLLGGSELLLSAFGAAAFFLVIVLISRGRWMGVGDIKLAFLIGLILGWPAILVGLFFAFLIGAIIGVGLIISGKKTLKSEVPFGPFLVMGTFIAFYWGQEIINWYAKILHFN